jgi:hypothetical protein
MNPVLGSFGEIRSGVAAMVAGGAVPRKRLMRLGNLPPGLARLGALVGRIKPEAPIRRRRGVRVRVGSALRLSRPTFLTTNGTPDPGFVRVRVPAVERAWCGSAALVRIIT